VKEECEKSRRLPNSIARSYAKMNRQELKIKLDEMNISEFWYSLDGEAIPNKTILQKGGGKEGYWIIYGIDERGNRYDFREFYYENEACVYFYQIMKKSKERDERIQNTLSRMPQKAKRYTFIVSSTGEVERKEEK